MSISKKKLETVNFEQSMQTLETIVKQLEAGDLPLEDSLKIYEQGVKLAAQCQKALTQAEQKVAILSNMGTEKEIVEPYNRQQEQDDLWNE